MQVMLGPADAVDSRFFGAPGRAWGGWHLPSKSPLDADAARFSRVRGSFTLLMPMMFASVEGHALAKREFT